MTKVSEICANTLSKLRKEPQQPKMKKTKVKSDTNSSISTRRSTRSRGL